MQAFFIQPEHVIVHAVFPGEALDHIIGIDPAGNRTGADEAGDLDLFQAGFGQRVDQLDLAAGADGARLDLEAFTGAFLVQFHF